MRPGRIEANLTVHEILAEASAVAAGVLLCEHSGFDRCGFAKLGLNILFRNNSLLLQQILLHASPIDVPFRLHLFVSIAELPSIDQLPYDQVWKAIFESG